MHFPTIILAVASAISSVSAATTTGTTFVPPTASLSYGNFSGSYNAYYNISYFRKIPFAAPPIGRNRFRAPQSPNSVGSAVYNTDQDYDTCPQKGNMGSEDCLYLGLYSRPWSKGQTLKPVLVNFYGGGFIQGGGSFSLPPAGYPTLNVSRDNDFVMVYPNYRVNSFGFLPGKVIHDDPYSDLNPGLLDQQYVLRWVRSNIAQFGGDATNVTIWGQSAGAGSVVAQVIANNGNTYPKLFQKALASSPFWPKVYNYNDTEAETIFNQLVNLTGCAKAKIPLSCLKYQTSMETIRNASAIIAQSNTYNGSSFTWAPVIDGSFLTQSLSTASLTGRVNSYFNFGMYNSHEGENFLPAGLDYDTWLHAYFPRLKPSQLSQITAMYPVNGSTETFSYNTTRERAGVIFRDAQLACPAYFIAQASKTKGYLGEFTIFPAKHGSDTGYWNRVGTIQTTDSFTYHGYTGALASFIQTGDPNAHKLTNKTVPGVPWLQSAKSEFVIKQSNFTTANISSLAARCAMWRSFGSTLPI